MTADHLVREAREQRRHVELAALDRDLRMEDHLEEEVSELFLQRLGVARLDHLVGFFDQERLEGGAGLFAIPRASSRFAQPPHDLEEPFELSAGGLGHDRFLEVRDYTARVCACARLAQWRSHPTRDSRSRTAVGGTRSPSPHSPGRAPNRVLRARPPPRCYPAYPTREASPGSS